MPLRLDLLLPLRALRFSRHYQAAVVAVLSPRPTVRASITTSHFPILVDSSWLMLYGILKKSGQIRKVT
jgi:hypothetical protein